VARVEHALGHPRYRVGRARAAAVGRSLDARVSARTVRLASVLVAFVAGALFVLSVASNELLTGSLHSLWHVDLRLLVASILVEALSLAAYGLMVQRLLRRVGVSTRVRLLLETTFAGVALSSSIPAGAAASAVYWYRALRAYGANRRQATRVLIVITLVSIASLAALVAAGAAIAEAGAVSGPARLTLLAGVATVAAVLLTRRLGGSLYRLGIAALASANWLLDCLALYVALRAVSADVPFRALVATYAVAQIVAVIPLLPGGGGTVEASLALGFAAFGHTSGSVVAGVVLYRLISNWGLVPIGWAAIVLRQRSHPTAALDARDALHDASTRTHAATGATDCRSGRIASSSGADPALVVGPRGDHLLRGRARRVRG
jgi:putative heme transporter